MRKKSDCYCALIERFRLRPIRSDAEPCAAHQLAQELYLRLGRLDAGESDYLEVISTLIELYEAKAYPLKTEEITPCEVLDFLMKQNDLRQVYLARILGVSSGRASELVNGARDLSKAQIAILADHFKVGADLFLRTRAISARPEPAMRSRKRATPYLSGSKAREMKVSEQKSTRPWESQSGDRKEKW